MAHALAYIFSALSPLNKKTPLSSPLTPLTEAFGQQIAYKFIVVSHVEDAVDAWGHQLFLGVSKVTRHVLRNKDDTALPVDDEEKPIEGLKWTGGQERSDCVYWTGIKNFFKNLLLYMYSSPLAAWAPVPLSPPAPGYWRRCRSSAPRHLETEELLSLLGGNKHKSEMWLKKFSHLSHSKQGLCFLNISPSFTLIYCISTEDQLRHVICFCLAELLQFCT